MCQYRDVLLTQELLPVIRSTASTKGMHRNIAFVTQLSCAVRHPSSSIHSRHVASQQSWPQPGWLLRLGHDVEAFIPLQVAIRDTRKMRQRLVEAWVELQRSMVDNAINRWRKRLEACIHIDGGHYEHLLWRCVPDIQVATQHFSQPPVSHNTTRLFTATNISRETIYLPSDECVLHFTR